MFTIGLFCNENFPRDGFRRLLVHHGFDPDRIEKVDISEGKMHIHTGTAVDTLDVKEASRFARGGCKICPDFWNACAELSVGNCGSGKGWSTLIIRSERARAFVKSAAAAGVIELGDASFEDVKAEQERKLKKAKTHAKKTGKEGYMNSWEQDEWESFIEKSRKNLFPTLEKEVIDTGLCILCGACAAVCPEKNVIIEERPYALHRCPEECGCCYMACPRTHSFLSVLSRPPLATYAARAVRSHENVQAGGVITELLAYGIKKGLFESVVVAGTVDSEPISVVTNDVVEIEKAAGSKYVTIPQVFALTKGR
ncbi:MAG: Coenzyme F420 hydrogenase/dehydrogenase, beta subunit C-terminal domain [Theionarchaea archaeon]|nr:Coenzyme F420 hydrogenase/dehydrogenase, beta subunit C-terminal domain [Theionarchaea archaeon]